ncbi:MAG: MCP four helix bundle domain-containing protein, partial [Oscillospiraceae bacterium]
MKNLKITGKLTIGFGIILVLMLVSTVLSYLSLTALYSQIEQYRDDALPNTIRVWTARRYNISLQRYMSLIWNVDDEETRQKYIDKLNSEQDGFDSMLEEIKQNAEIPDDTLEQMNAILAVNDECQQKLLDLAEDPTAFNISQAKNILIKEYIPNATQFGDVI